MPPITKTLSRPLRRVFVISDLHLGGRPDKYAVDGSLERAGGQICFAYDDIVHFVDWLASGSSVISSSEDLELVINGDIVDFLADDEGDGFSGSRLWVGDQDEVIRRLEQIIRRSTCGDGRTIVDALRTLLAKGARLTLLLGNHDVELSLPRVREHLRRLLGGDRVRLSILYDGEAYSVGTALIEHGNRYDAWNVVNHSRLRQERSVLSRGEAVDEAKRRKDYFVPPAGTHLVHLLMNRIKSRYRFVDLLKPEDKAIVPMLIALEPDGISELAKLLKAAPSIIRSLATISRRLYGKSTGPGDPFVRQAGDLGGAVGPTTDISLVNDVLLASLGEDAPQIVDVDGDQGIKAAASRMNEKLGPIVASGKSLSRVAWDVIQGRDATRTRWLKRSLRTLCLDDPSFDISREVERYLAPARHAIVVGGYDTVVYGHTHLPKQIVVPREGRPDGMYINTGTWADVIRVADAWTRGVDSEIGPLAEFVEDVKENRLGAYVKRYLSYAELLIDFGDGGRVREVSLRGFGGQSQPRADALTDRSDR